MGRTHAQLIPPPLPEAVAHVWRWFLELDAARGRNEFGPEPIRYVDVDAWRRLTGARPRPYEIGWLLELDRMGLRIYAEGKK